MATHKPIYIDDLFGSFTIVDTENWYVAHTKPRQEKKLALFSKAEDIYYYLPQVDKEHVYKNRKVKFEVPLFSGYVFVRLDEKKKQSLLYSGTISQFIKVNREEELLKELRSIYKAKINDVKTEKAAWIAKGYEVLIKSGPLQGMMGIVESQNKLTEVFLRVQILHQAVRIVVPTADIELIRLIDETEKLL